jgi:hypothetical protein
MHGGGRSASISNLHDRRGRNSGARQAVAAALSYIRRRRPKMRYAAHYAANLPIGSGATENTCWAMQRRVKLPGQSWEAGLGGVLAIRGLVLSDRWEAAWQPFAAAYRKEVSYVRARSGVAA